MTGCTGKVQPVLQTQADKAGSSEIYVGDRELHAAWWDVSTPQKHFTDHSLIPASGAAAAFLICRLNFCALRGLGLLSCKIRCGHKTAVIRHRCASALPAVAQAIRQKHGPGV